MIIFDLDGTLADCEHRRHFVDPEKNPEFSHRCNPRGQENMQELSGWYHLETNRKFKPDWKSFYEACDKDTPIQPVIRILRDIQFTFPECEEIQIWSGRCESVRIKTHSWIFAHTGFEPCRDTVKMRPIGDNTPDDQLKEKWLDDLIRKNIKEQFSLNENPDPKKYDGCHGIELVFDDRPKVVRMWRRRGIFVFDVNQSGKEF